MSGSERRVNTRVPLQVPIRFRPVTTPASAEQSGETVNVSQRGMYMATSFPLQVGAQVELELSMPEELAGAVANLIRCTASVVHVQPDKFFGGKAGVGLRIERYEREALNRTERWAN